MGDSYCKRMFHYMPEIIWHDRESLLSVDFQTQKDDKFEYYKLVTSSLRNEIRIWKIDFRMLPSEKEDLGVFFISNLVGHRSAVNVARFSPDGNLLVSGDCDGCLVVWKIGPFTAGMKATRTDDLPANLENWVRYRTPLSHDADICSLCWSPDSDRFATASYDESVAVYDVCTGNRLWHLKSFRHFPNGITWDPHGKYIVTMSTDRKMDILCAKKGIRLRCIQSVHLPNSSCGNKTLSAGNYKLFHDDQLMFYSRIPDFSPDGELLLAPSGHLEASSTSTYGTFIFRRRDFHKGRPAAFIPSTRPTYRVLSCPVVYKLREESSENGLRLPYRVVWAVVSKDSVSVFDSQHCRCIAYVTNIHYDCLSDIAWSADGRVLMVSSLEGYISFIRFGDIALGEKYVGEIGLPPASPQLRRNKKRRKRGCGAAPSVHSGAQPRKRPGSPVNSILKYFKKIGPLEEEAGALVQMESVTKEKKMHSDETLAHTEVERREAVRSGMKSRSSEKRSGDISGGEKDTESATTKPGKKRLKLESEPLTKID